MLKASALIISSRPWKKFNPSTLLFSKGICSKLIELELPQIVVPNLDQFRHPTSPKIPPQRQETGCSWSHQIALRKFVDDAGTFCTNLVRYMTDSLSVLFANCNRRSQAYTALGKLFSESQYFENKKSDDTEDSAAITAIDFEEQSAGYQASFSRLAASETAEVDPVAYVQNPSDYLQQSLAKLSNQYGQQVQVLIANAEGGRIN